MICVDCHQPLPEGSQATRLRCAACKREHQRARWRRRARERRDRGDFRSPDLYERMAARRYGLALDDYRELVGRGVCDACGKTEGKFHIDHDHACCPEPGRSCGKCVRGLLCARCNLMAGYIEKDPEAHAAVLDYLAASRGGSR